MATFLRGITAVTLTLSSALGSPSVTPKKRVCIALQNIVESAKNIGFRTLGPRLCPEMVGVPVRGRLCPGKQADHQKGETHLGWGACIGNFVDLCSHLCFLQNPSTSTATWKRATQWPPHPRTSPLRARCIDARADVNSLVNIWLLRLLFQQEAFQSLPVYLGETFSPLGMVQRATQLFYQDRSFLGRGGRGWDSRIHKGSCWFLQTLQLSSSLRVKIIYLGRKEFEQLQISA